MKRIPPILPLFLLLIAVSTASAQTISVSQPDGANQAQLEVENRNATVLTDDSRKGIHLDANAGSGVAWIQGSPFQNGIIEVDVRGADLPGRSFVGLAFNREENGAYEVVYFRPFNFKNKERSQNALQYSYEPEFGWRRLRNEHPGVFESAIVPPPESDSWVRLRLDLDNQTIRVYVNDYEEPSLVVDRLSKNAQGQIGLWVGNNSAGDFSDIRIESR